MLEQSQVIAAFSVLKGKHYIFETTVSAGLNIRF